MRCVPWDWSDSEPPDFAWHEITQCVASEVVYYDEFRGAGQALARVLATVLHRCRPGMEVLLMLRMRAHQGSVENSTMVPTDDYDERTSVFNFIEQLLPQAGLRADLIPLTNGRAEERENYGLRMFQISLAPLAEGGTVSEQAAGAPPLATTGALPGALPMSSDDIIGQFRRLVGQHDACPMALDALHAQLSALVALAASGLAASGLTQGVDAAVATAGSGGSGGDRETSAGWMDAAERAARGFSADEEVVMPLPNFDDSEED